jgi:hypothetical protein
MSGKNSTSHSRFESCSRRRSVSPERRNRSRSRSQSPPRNIPHEKECFSDIYNYYKYKLLQDQKLMVAGSSAYLNTIHKDVLSIPRCFPVQFELPLLSLNIDQLYEGAPFHVREDGIYSIFFLLNSDEPSQFSIFVNGIEGEYSRLGNNSGSGQLLLKSIIRLKAHDAVCVRNSESTAVSIDTILNSGGSATGGGSVTFTIMKIAPLQEEEVSDNNDDDLCKSEKKLFKKLQCKLLEDENLMLQGFNIHGSFYTLLEETVTLESDVQWDNYLNVAGLTWDPLYPERITVSEDGIYKIFFMANVVRAAQMCIAINGIPIEHSTQGVNKGASQLSLRSLLPLRKGDFITIRNHSSSNGDLEFIKSAGGGLDAIAAITLIFKIAPLWTLPMQEPDFKNCYYINLFSKFRTFLLANEDLNLKGSVAFISACSSTPLTLELNKNMDFNITSLQRDVDFVQGTFSFTIKKAGIYDLSLDLLTNQPHQITQFVNNVADLTTVSGRNSGGSRGMIKQFSKYNAGDVLNYRNYQSSAGNLIMSLNAGGLLVGKNRSIILFYLSKGNYPLKSMKCKVLEEDSVKVKAKEVKVKEYIYF